MIGIIGDEDTVTGFLLAGIGDVNRQRGENFLVVERETKQATIEEFFKKLTARPDISVVLITQEIANTIRQTLDEYEQLLPTILEIPSPSQPYSSEKDSMMVRINKMLGAQ
uniref:V-type proton ATPase subunit F n=1 Tax=Arcella intermedia TaxID=1963864 RepID=A0A6B2LRL0_9EUKA